MSNFIFLKNSYRVEVDAEKGIIRILQKKRPTTRGE